MAQVKRLLDEIHSVIADIEYYITGILRGESMVSIEGQYKQMKTYFTMQLGLSLAVGRDFLNYFRVKPEGTKVLYVNYELSEEEFLSRLQEVAEAMNITTPGNFYYLTINENWCIDLTTDKIDEVLSINKPEVVILDPRYGFMRGREDEQSAMNLFVGNLKVMKAKHKCSFIVISHMGKDATKGARGHSLWDDAVDTIVRLTGSERGQQKGLTITGRNTEAMRLELKVDFPLLSIHEVMIKDSQSKVDKAQNFILDLLKQNNGAMLRAIIVKQGRREFSQNTIQRALDRHKANGVISVEPLAVKGNHKLVKLNALE